MSWGLAEEGARSAAYLSMLGFPAMDVFARLLARLADVEHATVKPVVFENHCSTQGDFLCPVYAGAWLLDSIDLIASPEQTFDFNKVAEPLIFSSFVLRGAISQNLSISITTGDSHARCDDGRLKDAFDLIDLEVVDNLRVTANSKSEMQWNPEHQRGTCTDESLASLLGFAHHTYVPATEASRLAGAGAGLTDND